MKKYKDVGRAKIKKDKLTAAQVAALDYWGTAALCGVALAPNGDSPADFFYEHIRRDLAHECADAEKKAAREAQRAKLQAKIDADPDLAGLIVGEDASGNLIITRPPSPVEVAYDTGFGAGVASVLGEDGEVIV